MNAQTLLALIRKDLKDTDFAENQKKLSAEELVYKYTVPALTNLKDIQSSLYSEFFLDENGWKRKVKNKVIRKISNVARNTVEQPITRQQKFNENIVAVIEFLLEENQKLKAELSNLKK